MDNTEEIQEKFETVTQVLKEADNSAVDWFPQWESQGMLKQL